MDGTIMLDDDQKKLLNEKYTEGVRAAEQYMHAGNYPDATLSLIDAAACVWRLFSPVQSDDPDRYLMHWKRLASALCAIPPSVLRQSVKLLDDLSGPPPGT